jgi:type I restriction enzyme S subunit
MGVDWRSRSFEDLVLSNALVIGDGYRAKNAELNGRGPLFLRSGRVHPGRIDFTGGERLDDKLLMSLGPKLGQPRDTVMTTKGNSIGISGFVPLDAPPFVYSPHLSYWRALDEQVVTPGFLRYWAQGKEFRQQLRGMAGSTDMAPYLSLADQRRLRITLPRVDEQRRIAGVLGALDDKIEHNERLRDSLVAVARQTFTRVGDEFVRVGDIADLAKGLSYKGSGLESSGIPLFNLANFTTGAWLDRARLKYYSGDYGERHVVKSGAILIANTDLTQRRAILGQPLLVPEGFERALFTHHVFTVRFKRGFERLRNALYFALQSHAFRARAEGFATGTTVAALPREALLNFAFLAPDDPTLQRINRRADVLIRRAWRAEEESIRLREIRDAMLPKLVSGRIRVPESYAA